MIPNRHFWAELPVLVRDGAVFTYRTARGLNRANAEESTAFAGSGAAPRAEPLISGGDAGATPDVHADDL